MYKIKQIPEDFVVKEINDLKFDENGSYSYFLLKKRSYNTLRAIQQIAKRLNINEKNVGFAGNKDKNAVTEQVISIFNFNKNVKTLELKDIELEFLGKGNEKIFLGSLTGNNFTLTIRNINNKESQKIKNKIKNNEILMPNYFGPQRFSINNQEIGKNIVKKNFKEAIDLILSSNTDYNEKISSHLVSRKNDFIGALRLIPLKLLRLYVHSYQSFLFNKILEQYIKLNKKSIKIHNKNKKTVNKNLNQKIPIIGFGMEPNHSSIYKIIKKIMDEEKVNERDFVMSQIPELSSEGNERQAFIKINDFEIIKTEKDELNKNKEKAVVKFFLPKGCYATVLVDFLFSGVYH